MRIWILYRFFPLWFVNSFSFCLFFGCWTDRFFVHNLFPNCWGKIFQRNKIYKNRPKNLPIIFNWQWKHWMFFLFVLCSFYALCHGLLVFLIVSLFTWKFIDALKKSAAAVATNHTHVIKYIRNILLKSRFKQRIKTALLPHNNTIDHEPKATPENWTFNTSVRN